MMDDTTQFLSQEDQEAVNAMFDTNSQTADTPQPGFFTRARVAASEVPGALFGAAQDTANDAKAAAQGIPHALANTGLDVAQTTVTGATAVPRQYANELAAESGVTLKPLNPTGTYYPQLAENPARGVLDAGVFGPEQRAADAANQWITDTRATANEMYRPDPQTTGVVGNALFGLADVGTRIGVGNLLAPGTGLLQAAASTGFERTQELEHPTEPGVTPVDETTAIESGVLQGGSLLAMGGTTGALGKTALQRMITAALTNELFTAGATAGDSAILRANGYDKLADQERWNDAASLISNGLIGVFFGVLPHEPGAPSPRALPGAADAIDAALTQKNAAHVMKTAPGVPADPVSQRAHVEALDTATAQVLNGEDVNVEPVVRGATFVPRPEPEGLADAIGETKDELPPEQTLAADSTELQRLSELRDQRAAGTLTLDQLNEFADLSEKDRLTARIAGTGERIPGVLNMEAWEKRPSGQVGFVDADNFKELNDELGHKGGDVLIRTFGQMLSEAAPRGSVFHRGGDEFLLSGDPDQINATLAKVNERLGRFQLELGSGDRTYRRNVFLSHGVGEDEQAAEQALQAAKSKRLAAGLRTERSGRRAHDAGRGGETVTGGGGERGFDQAGAQAAREAAQLGRQDQPAGMGGSDQGSGERSGAAEPDLNPAAGGVSVSGVGSLDADASPSQGTAEPQPSAGRAGPQGAEPDSQAGAGAGANPGEATLNTARQALAENPDLTLPDGTPAVEAMKAADAEVTQAQQEANGIAAALQCFLKYGSDL